MSEPTVRIWSYEHNQWWRPNQHGYTNNIKEAGLYPRAEADEICELANRHRPKGNPDECVREMDEGRP